MVPLCRRRGSGDRVSGNILGASACAGSGWPQRTFLPNDISKFTAWLEEAVRDAVQMVETGSYQGLVERELPIWHRTGTILRRDLWRVFPQWKEEFFQDFSQQEMEEFLTSAVGYPLEKKQAASIHDRKRLLSLLCPGLSGYGLHRNGEIGKKSSTPSTPMGGTRDCPSWTEIPLKPLLGGLKERPRTGHPWEVCRGGNSTHIDCIVHRDAHGYYLVVAGLAETRTIEAVRFFLALHRAGVPVCIRNAEKLKARLTERSPSASWPEGVFPAYCHARFPGEDIVDFMNLPREHQDELAKYCRWQPIPVPRMKKRR